MEKLKPILKYVGTIGAVLMAIAYIAIVCVMVFGLKAQADLAQSIAFAIVNAIIGLIIMQFLKVQGVDLAKSEEKNAAILTQYYNTKTKDKKPHSMNYFWVRSVLTDVIVKGLSIGATTLGIIYIVIRGSQDYSYLLLALVNLLMFCCFGFLSLVKAYDFFNNENIPYIKERLKEMEEDERRKEETKALEKEREERENKTDGKEIDEGTPCAILQEGNDNVPSSGGGDILDPGLDSSNICAV